MEVVLNREFLTKSEYQQFRRLTYQHPKVVLVHCSHNGLHEQELRDFAIEMHSLPEECCILESEFTGNLKSAIKLKKELPYLRMGNLSKDEFRTMFEAMYGPYKKIPGAYVALHESITNSGMVDDGPGIFFRDLRSYKNRAERFAGMLGWRVLSYTIDQEMEKYNTDYPNGSGNLPVSWGPQGTEGVGLPTDDLEDTVPAWKAKWLKNLNLTVSNMVGLGWEFAESI